MRLFAVVMGRHIVMSALLPWEGFLYLTKAPVEERPHVRKMGIVIQVSFVFFRKVSAPGPVCVLSSLKSAPCIVFILRFVAVT